MGAVSVRRRGMGGPDPRVTWIPPTATAVPNGIVLEDFFQAGKHSAGMRSRGVTPVKAGLSD